MLPVPANPPPFKCISSQIAVLPPETLDYWKKCVYLCKLVASQMGTMLVSTEIDMTSDECRKLILTYFADHLPLLLAHGCTVLEQNGCVQSVVIGTVEQLVNQLVYLGIIPRDQFQKITGLASFEEAKVECERLVALAPFWSIINFAVSLKANESYHPLFTTTGVFCDASTITPHLRELRVHYWQTVRNFSKFTWSEYRISNRLPDTKSFIVLAAEDDINTLEAMEYQRTHWTVPTSFVGASVDEEILAVPTPPVQIVPERTLPDSSSWSEECDTLVIPAEQHTSAASYYVAISAPANQSHDDRQPFGITGGPANASIQLNRIADNRQKQAKKNGNWYGLQKKEFLAYGHLLRFINTLLSYTGFSLKITREVNMERNDYGIRMSIHEIPAISLKCMIRKCDRNNPFRIEYMAMGRFVCELGNQLKVYKSGISTWTAIYSQKVTEAVVTYLGDLFRTLNSDMTKEQVIRAADLFWKNNHKKLAHRLKQKRSNMMEDIRITVNVTPQPSDAVVYTSSDSHVDPAPAQQESVAVEPVAVKCKQEPAANNSQLPSVAFVKKEVKKESAASAAASPPRTPKKPTVQLFVSTSPDSCHGMSTENRPSCSRVLVDELARSSPASNASDASASLTTSHSRVTPPLSDCGGFAVQVAPSPPICAPTAPSPTGAPAPICAPPAPSRTGAPAPICAPPKRDVIRPPDGWQEAAVAQSNKRKLQTNRGRQHKRIRWN